MCVLCNFSTRHCNGCVIVHNCQQRISICITYRVGCQNLLSDNYRDFDLNQFDLWCTSPVHLGKPNKRAGIFVAWAIKLMSPWRSLLITEMIQSLKTCKAQLKVITKETGCELL